ncbi:DNA polymerase delta subunit 4 [Rhizophlyctis rosea]|nr:DNA polymerase delta subunit 4 [Rhizophlyctis rosea]
MRTLSASYTQRKLPRTDSCKSTESVTPPPTSSPSSPLDQYDQRPVTDELYFAGQHKVKQNTPDWSKCGGLSFFIEDTQEGDEEAAENDQNAIVPSSPVAPPSCVFHTYDQTINSTIRHAKASTPLGILRAFDLDATYGPCLGITRLERWHRARELGLEPPEEVKALLVGGKEGPKEVVWSFLERRV